jgi:hypothetical protein
MAACGSPSRRVPLAGRRADRHAGHCWATPPNHERSHAVKTVTARIAVADRKAEHAARALEKDLHILARGLSVKPGLVTAGLVTLYAVLRVESDRTCFAGVYRSRAAAERFIRADLQELAGAYERHDYHVVETRVED